MSESSELGPVGDLSVADVAEQRWQVRPEPASERFALRGWSYEQQVDVVCPRCQGALHTLRKPYESAGKIYRYVAVVCPGCPATFTLPDLGLKQHADLLSRPSVQVPVDTASDRVGDTSVAGVAQAKWGVRPDPAVARYALPGWQYLRETELSCPTCSNLLHGLFRVYHQQGQPRVQTAVVCPDCPATFTTRQLKVPRGAVLGEFRADILSRDPRTAKDGPTAPTRRERAAVPVRPATNPVRPVTPPGDKAAGTDHRHSSVVGADRPATSGVRVRPVRAGQLPGLLAALTPQTTRARRGGLGPVRDVVVAPPVEQRLLYWRKTTDPTLILPDLPAGTDARVLLPDSAPFEPLRERLTDAGVAYRSVAHWVEDEVLSTVESSGELAPLSVTTALTAAGGVFTDWALPALDQPAYDARDAFEKIWDSHNEDDLDEQPPPVPAAQLVPAEWLGYLPFAELNPAQAHAAPAVLGASEHLVITAPTGAGKTVVGMLAALRAILGEGRKAAWLVPQRSLTDELDRELEGWRGRGLKVERLSGEYSTDIEKVRVADLWIATTEKFEAICRASSLQTALSEVGCLVVDEIHLLGAAERGPLLEALLARVRGADSPVRIVGLSATVSNAAEIAEWLDGTLIATTWRPSRLTWQLPMIPASSDRTTDTALRARVAVDLAQRITDDGGSVLVFCGTKPKVRTTALALATARGANTAGVGIDDIDRLHEVCASVKIGLHYKDWEFKREAETRFRNREWDILVATTTVAAGVNLPARAVIVRDTQVGLDELDVATVLQMFGRAGRIGAGEREGWAYLLTTELERANWQGALVDGYTVYSQIHASLPDHVLAEVLQGRITNIDEAEQWWLRTLCHHQGDDDTEPVAEAITFLVDHGYLIEKPRPDDTMGVAVTELGRLTARLMIGTRVGANLRSVLAELAPPSDPDNAEHTLIHAVATLVPELAFAPVAEPQRPVVATILKAGGRRDCITSGVAVTGLGAAVSCAPGDLARAVMLLVARSPHLFAHPGRMIAGLPSSTVFPVLEQAPRYLTWLGAQGHLGTVHPWVAIVAADLGRRIRWRRLAPGRGAGRLLWICEQMATAPHAADVVPKLWQAATERRISSPDWPHATPPSHCQLEPGDYTSLLRERTTGCVLTVNDDHAEVHNLVSGVMTTWIGRTTVTTTVAGVASSAYPVPDAVDGDGADAGAAVFTRRGDYHAAGWPAEHYHRTMSPDR